MQSPMLIGIGDLLYGEDKLVKMLKYLAFRSLIRIFAENREDTFAPCEKYSSKLDISRSLIRIFVGKQFVKC